MNRRLVLATLVLVGIGGAAAPALATSPDSTRHKICVSVPQGDPTQPAGDGICLNWVGPIQPQ